MVGVPLVRKACGINDMLIFEHPSRLNFIGGIFDEFIKKRGENE